MGLRPKLEGVKSKYKSNQPDKRQWAVPEKKESKDRKGREKKKRLANKGHEHPKGFSWRDSNPKMVEKGKN